MMSETRMNRTRMDHKRMRRTQRSRRAARRGIPPRAPTGRGHRVALAPGGPPAVRTRAAEMHCSFGATRVGPLLARVRLHLSTERFLAERRRDAVWEAGCDYAALALLRLESRLRFAARETALRATLDAPRGRRR
jgi:hypothetical protein